MIQNRNLLNLLEHLSTANEISDYLFIHYGNLNQDIAISTIHLIEKKMKLENFDRNAITKTKTVCIEIIQNIIKHHEEHDNIFPYFILGSNGKQLSLFSGNVITHESKEIISNSIDTFLTIGKEERKKYYLDALKDSAITTEGNAGMGLMDIVFKSDQHLSYKIYDLPNNLYFYDMNLVLHQKEEVLVK